MFVLIHTEMQIPCLSAGIDAAREVHLIWFAFVIVVFGYSDYLNGMKCYKGSGSDVYILYQGFIPELGRKWGTLW